MRKGILLLMLLAGLLSHAYAQKQKIYIAPFKYAGADVRQLLPALRSAIIEGISKTNRVDIIDTPDPQATLYNTIELAKNAGAGYVLECEMANHNLVDAVNVLKVVTDAVSNTKSPSGTHDELSYTVKLIRVDDGVVVNSHRMTNTGYGYSSYTPATGAAASAYSSASSMGRATDNALYWVVGQIGKYIEAVFPLEASILEVAEGSESRLKSVYINLGSTSPIHVGVRFKVCVSKEVAGNAVYDAIGQVKVTDIKGEKVSLCKVTKGAKSIAEALNSHVHLVLISEVK